MRSTIPFVWVLSFAVVLLSSPIWFINMYINPRFSLEAWAKGVCGWIMLFAFCFLQPLGKNHFTVSTFPRFVFLWLLSSLSFLFFIFFRSSFFFSSPQSIKINEESMVPVYHLIVIKMNLLRGSPSAIRSRVGHPKQSTGSESEREGENCCHQRKKTSIYRFFPLIGNWSLGVTFLIN